MHGLSSGMAEDDESDDCRVNKSPSILFKSTPKGVFFLLLHCFKIYLIITIYSKFDLVVRLSSQILKLKYRA